MNQGISRVHSPTQPHIVPRTGWLTTIIAMQIHQLQASYQADQDRILLRLNTHSGEEMRVWLTRRMLKGMLGHVQKLADQIPTLHPAAAAAGTSDDDNEAATTARCSR